MGRLYVSHCASFVGAAEGDQKLISPQFRAVVCGCVCVLCAADMQI